MKRPSHWILLSIALGAVAYVALSPLPGDGDRTADRGRGPVVVRRAEGPPLAMGGEEQVTLRGLVRDRLGWPVVGARAELMPVLQDAIAPVFCDEHGSFALQATKTTPRLVRITAPEHEDVWTWLLGGETTPIVLADALPWSAPLAPPAAPPTELVGEGFLRDTAGRAIADATVAVVGTGVTRHTDDTGRYRIPLPVGRASVLAAWDEQGRAALSEPLEPSRDRGLVPLPEMVMEPAGAVHGFVRDRDGAVVAQAGLLLRSAASGERRTVTDASGAFRFAGLPAGDYVLDVLPHRGSPGSRHAVALVDQRVADLELSVGEMRPFELRVVDTEEQPLPGVWVVAEEDDLRRAAAVTDAQGRARLEGLGEGPYAFEVRAAAASDFQGFEVTGFDVEEAVLHVRR